MPHHDASLYNGRFSSPCGVTIIAESICEPRAEQGALGEGGGEGGRVMHACVRAVRSFMLA